ncbi:hypothetical protein SAY86_009084 [Trapa natans]|uniref:Uncharacterized protein n=1 Tax=Trapa natans TaxID=22666 RepID=A0AAN7KAP0_TRANT|nr:hypothetical protein SAY86_009084 [Trapa natans]
MEDKATLIRQVFGDSSDDDDYQNYELNSRSEPESSPVAGESADAGLFRNPGWERVKEIRGLWICRDFLTHVQQLSLLSAIQNEGWFLQESHNQAMRFGDLPGWVNGLSYSIREALLSGDNLSEPSFTSEEETLFPILPLELLGREPLFDQLIVNLYHPGQVGHVPPLSFVTIAFE